MRYLLILLFAIPFVNAYDISHNFDGVSPLEWRGTTTVQYTNFTSSSNNDVKVGYYGVVANYSTYSLNNTKGYNSSVSGEAYNTTTGTVGRLYFWFPQCNIDDCYLTPDTNLSLSLWISGITSTINLDASPTIIIGKLNNNNSNSFNTTSLKLQYHANEDGDQLTGYCLMNDLISGGEFNQKMSILQRHNTTDYYDHVQNCSDGFYIENSFNAMIVYFGGYEYDGDRQTYNITIDNLLITNVINISNNRLPELNYRQSYTVSLNSSGKYLFQFPVVATDPEGDQIYWSSTISQSENETHIIDFSRDKGFPFCQLNPWCANSDSAPDHSVFDNLVTVNGACDYAEFTQSAMTDLMQIYPGVQGWYLNFDGSCNGTPVLQYKYDRSTNIIDNTLYITGWGYNDTLYFSPMNERNKHIANIKLYRNTTNTSINILNGDTITYVGYFNESDVLNITVENYGDQIGEFDLRINGWVWGNLPLTNNYTRINSLYMQASEGSDWNLWNFSYQLTGLDSGFTPVSPGSFEFTKPQTILFTGRVTDFHHLATESVLYQYEVKAINPMVIPNGTNSSNTTYINDSGYNYPINHFEKSFGMSNLLDSTGMRGVFTGVFWFAYFLSLLFLFFTIGFPLNLVAASLGFLFISLIFALPFVYNVALIIMLALGLSPIVSSLWS